MSIYSASLLLDDGNGFDLHKKRLPSARLGTTRPLFSVVRHSWAGISSLNIIKKTMQSCNTPVSRSEYFTLWICVLRFEQYNVSMTV
jgi:hypothetical protein